MAIYGTISLIMSSLIISISLLVLILACIALAREIWSKMHENEVMKNEFISIIAHKFRTPLTSMKWILENKIGEEKDVYKKENYGEIQKLTESLINMTGTLIETADAASSKSAYNFEKVNLCDFIKTITEVNKRLFHEKNLFFSVKCDADEIIVNIDKPRLEFVLQTLLENALAYTPPGKNVDVYISKRKHKAIINVKDNGIGINQKELPHLFTKFYRTDEAKRADTEGFGIALYISNSIVKRMKGKINVYSEGLGLGSTFEVVLPISK